MCTIHLQYYTYLSYNILCFRYLLHLHNTVNDDDQRIHHHPIINPPVRVMGMRLWGNEDLIRYKYEMSIGCSLPVSNALFNEKIKNIDNRLLQSVESFKNEGMKEITAILIHRVHHWDYFHLSMDSGACVEISIVIQQQMKINKYELLF